jgi:hypothetical protein
MAYRGGEATGQPSCAKHAAAPAEAACARCLQPICDICIVYFGAQPHCHPCALKRRRNRTIGRVVLSLAAVVLVGGTVIAIRRTPARELPHTDSPDVVRLRKERAAKPCDRPTALALGEALLTDDNAREALADGKAFLAQCGDWYRLHWTAYTAHERLGEWQGAVDEASLLIKHNPADHDYYWWRGSAEEQLGQLDRAADDYRMTLVRLPNAKNIPFNLARVYEKQAQPCRAVATIEQFLFHYPDERKTPSVSEYLQRLVKAGHCERLAGQGAAIVKPWGEPKSLTGRVKVGGREKGRFVIEPSDAYVVVTRKLAEALSLDLTKAPVMQIAVDGQLQPAKLVTLPELSIDGAHAADVEAAVVDALPDELDGRIGLSFLTRFELSIDRDDPDGELGLVAP